VVFASLVAALVFGVAGASGVVLRLAIWVIFAAVLVAAVLPVIGLLRDREVFPSLKRSWTLLAIAFGSLGLAYLAASGLLVRKIGGPSVKPYHPPGLYEQVVAQRDNPKATYTQGQGEDLHRRSLYTYWKRSVPHPGMLLFDAPFRETCSLRRPRTNTPLQALNLMNDPTYVEAARFLAQRMMKEAASMAGIPETTAPKVKRAYTKRTKVSA
jgi:hypothetical protein